MPKGGKVKSFMTTIQITDPEQHTWYNCVTATKVCDLYRYRLSSTDKFVPFVAPTASAPMAPLRMNIRILATARMKERIRAAIARPPRLSRE